LPQVDAAFLTDSQIRGVIKTMVGQVANSGTWLDRWGQIPDWATEVGAAGGPFWHIRRSGEKCGWPGVAMNDLDGPEAERSATYQLSLYYPYTLDEDDEEANPSEPDYDALVDAVLAKFEDEPNLNGNVFQASLLDYTSPGSGFVGIQVGQGVMVCHFGQFDIDIRQFRTRA
jgi:hypothetical protein